MVIEGSNQEKHIASKIGNSMAKFGSAMMELSKKSSEQTKVLTSMLSNQVREAYEKRRQERLASVQQKEDDKDKGNKSVLYNLKEKASAFTGKASGALEWGMDKLFSAATIAALAPIAIETAKALTEAALNKIGISPEFSKAISENIGSAVAWGSFGLLFGKKFAAIFAAGSLLWSYLDKEFSLGDKIEDIVSNIVGPDLAPAISNGLGFAMTTGLLYSAPKLIKGALGLAFDAAGKSLDLISSIADGVKPNIKSALSTASKTGMRAAMRFLPLAASAGIVALYAEYGDDAANWLSEQTGMSPDWSNAVVDSTSFAAAGASLGLMFGPVGGIVGGVAGLVAGLGYTVWKWFKGREAEAKAAAEEKIAETDKKIKGLDTNINPETGRNDNLVVANDSLQTAKDINSWQANQEIGRTYSPMEIAVQTDTDTQRGAWVGSESILKSAEELARNYSGTNEQNEEIVRGLHALLALKREFDEAKEANGGYTPKEFSNGYYQKLKRAYAILLSKGQGNIPDLESQIGNDGNIPKFKSGTRGFENFGTETLTLLHGKEAVIPENTEAAAFLKEFFNDDWTAKISRITGVNKSQERSNIISNSRDSSSSPVIYAPTTISPNSTIVGGSSVNNSRITALGGGGSDVDFGLPKGVF